jgi:WD40 repeat protein
LTIGGDARYLAAAYGDGSIVVHDMTNNDEFVLHLEQADGHPLAVACHPTDPILAVAGRSVRLYDLQTRELLFVLPQRQQGPFHWLAFSDSGHRLTAAGLRGVAIWRAK